MRTTTGTLLSILLLCAAPAHGGWIVEWQNVQIGPDGKRTDAGPATMKIQDGRVRLEQPNVITLMDYRRKRFTVMNPERRVFWSGTLDDYAAALEARRQARRRRRPGRRAPKQMKEDNPAVRKYPEVKVVRTETTETIAGHQTRKYFAFTPERTFQEFWLAEDIDTRKDLPPDDVLAYQRAMAATMLGKSAEEFGGLYRSPDYAKLLEKGFLLKTVTHHIAGGFERTATAVRQADIADGELRVPEGYRAVPLHEVLETSNQ